MRPAAVLRPHPLDRGNPPKWASAWGEDRYGIFAAFAVGRVEQRMRWIPPGTFWMGSPENEEGRLTDEARHQVTLTKGFWLADTPCTQALWEAVLGENFSCFQSPQRPVEQVSWDDAKLFLKQLGYRISGFQPRLPTEAEWEYACRAGTETTTYAGPMKILGTNNAPVLDPIAWYGGNSGEGFELDNGADSSGWEEKQYPHTRAGTRPVGLKKPNPWGLHDMLGNVWEWCEDWYGGYDTVGLENPLGSTKGRYRVLRGGSWSNGAGNGRAASRHLSDPSRRGSSLGFRLARSQD